MKIVYIYYGDHYLFDTWTKSLKAVKRSFIPSWLFDFKRLRNNDGSVRYKISNIFRKNPILMQATALVNSLFIPKADVYLLENMACVSSIYLKNTKKSKVILFNGDQFFKDFYKSEGLRRKISRKMFEKIDGVVSISYLYQDICKRYLKMPNKMVYPFLDVKRYSKSVADPKSKNICFLGYLVKLKGIDILVEAFMKLDKKYKDKLYLIGSKVDELGLLEQNSDNENIIVTGWADDPTKFMKECGIYVNPAHKESFGINVLEAMSMGIVPLVSKNCGVAEIVREVDERLIINTDSDEIVRKIKWLQNNMRTKKELAKKCIKTSRKYTAKKSVKEFKKSFEELTGEM